MVLIAATAVLGGVAARAGNPPPPPPDEDFLAYLGSWEGDDADWQVAQSMGAAERTRTTPTPVTQEPTRRTTAEGAARTAQEQKR